MTSFRYDRRRSRDCTRHYPRIVDPKDSPLEEAFWKFWQEVKKKQQSARVR